MERRDWIRSHSDNGGQSLLVFKATQDIEFVDSYRWLKIFRDGARTGCDLRRGFILFKHYDSNAIHRVVVPDDSR